MTRTWDDVAAARPAAETCPVCASADVDDLEQDWFVLELERGDEVRRDTADDRVRVEFACRACGSRWR